MLRTDPGKVISEDKNSNLGTVVGAKNGEIQLRMLNQDVVHITPDQVQLPYSFPRHKLKLQYGWELENILAAAEYAKQSKRPKEIIVLFAQSKNLLVLMRDADASVLFTFSLEKII